MDMIGTKGMKLRPGVDNESTTGHINKDEFVSVYLAINKQSSLFIERHRNNPNVDSILFFKIRKLRTVVLNNEFSVRSYHFKTKISKLSDYGSLDGVISM
ncbi:hypothetical protein V1477_003496, partial [Vespula maculifrons]